MLQNWNRQLLVVQASWGLVAAVVLAVGKMHAEGMLGCMQLGEQQAALWRGKIIKERRSRRMTTSELVALLETGRHHFREQVTSEIA